MIEILYPRPLIKRLMKGKRSFEKPAFYVEAARELGEEILIFSLHDIDWRYGTVSGWNGVDRLRVKRLIPEVIINRTRTARLTAKQRVRQLTELGKSVFNEHNVISKLTVHQILEENESLRPYLPETTVVTRQSIKHLLKENQSLFLKPSTASVGDGIIRIRKVQGDTFADMNVLGRTKRRKIGVRKIVGMVRGKKRAYLAQQGIKLMHYHGKPVDFRVSVQKDGIGSWQCTGMVGKVAKRQAFVTNIHCGGRSIKASELFRHWGWNENRIERSLSTLGVSIAETLERQLPGVADLGLDIALDEQGHPWFIEANFRDLRITFRNAGEQEIWRSTFANPVRYAAHLLHHRRGEGKGSTA